MKTPRWPRAWGQVVARSVCSDRAAAVIATAPKAVGDSDFNDSARAERHEAMSASLYQLIDSPLSAATNARHGPLSTTALSTGGG